MRPKIILALDVDSLTQAERFINKLYPEIRIFKVGPRIFTACGPAIIQRIRKRGAEVFLDLKFLDIPNTVAAAVRQATRLKVKMLTLHICGGKNMLRAAVKAARDESRLLRIKPPLLIGVTVLTSQKADAGAVLKLTRLGLACGLDGVVCSAQEASLLRRKIKGKFLIVTPGIRPNQSSSDDQKRIATVQEALIAGSDFLVVGRPILEAKNPRRTAEAMLKN